MFFAALKKNLFASHKIVPGYLPVRILVIESPVICDGGWN